MSFCSSQNLVAAGAFSISAFTPMDCAILVRSGNEPFRSQISEGNRGFNPQIPDFRDPEVPRLGRPQDFMPARGKWRRNCDEAAGRLCIRARRIWGLARNNLSVTISWSHGAVWISSPRTAPGAHGLRTGVYFRKRRGMRSSLRAAAVFVLILSGVCPGNQLLCGQKRSSTSGKQVASVDGAAITEAQVRAAVTADLDSLELQVLKSKASFTRREHAILEKSLDDLIEEKLLQSEAARRGISKEELLARELRQNAQEPTEKEIDAFYESNKQRINKPREEVAPQIKKYLSQQKENGAREAFLKRLEVEHRVVRSLPPLRYDVDAAGRPFLGPASAPVTLVVFSDFQCPYCKNYSTTLKELPKKYGKSVRLVFRQFPLASIHPFAQKAAEASLCAAEQGRFWEMHDLLFQDSKSLENSDLKAKAGKLGLKTAAFNACLDESRTSGRIREDMRAGAGAGVDGTPALFINGRFLNGVRSYEEIAAIIDEELKTKR